MNKLDKDYQDLVRDILENGRLKGDRTGTGTISVFDRHIKHNMADGFPMLTTKKMSLKNIKTELYWFLRGDTNIKFLVERGCNIWNGDAFKNWVNKEERPIKISYDIVIKGEGIRRGINVTKVEFFPDLTEVRLNSDGYYGYEDTDAGTGFYYIHMGHINSDSNEGILNDLMTTFLHLIKTDDSFCDKWGELGPIYGAQWRNWDGKDQIADLIHDLQHNPDSRRLMVNAWNVGKLDEMTLPPCHYGFQCYTEELTRKERWDWLRRKTWGTKHRIQWDRMAFPSHEWMDNYHNNFGILIPKRRLSLKWNQRSVDTGLGLPYNIASYGLLLLMLADEVNMVPHMLSGTLGDTHIYQNHVEPIQPQLTREPNELPKVHVRDGIHSHCDGDDIILSDYDPHPPIKLPLSN
jgi:thymidylate synthase